MSKVKTIGTFEAKTHFSQLLNEVEDGQRILVTRHGKPVAEISQPQTKKRARRGCARGAGFYMAPDFDAPLEDFKEYI